MGYVPKTPRRLRSYDSDRRDIKADISRLDRRRFVPVIPPGLVKVEPEAVEQWPPGTAWLDTSGE